jgi:hypothetical protein
MLACGYFGGVGGLREGNDVRYADEAYHEDAAGLQFVGEVAGCDAEAARNDVWRDLGELSAGTDINI